MRGEKCIILQAIVKKTVFNTLLTIFYLKKIAKKLLLYIHMNVYFVVKRIFEIEPGRLWLIRCATVFDDVDMNGNI